MWEESRGERDIDRRESGERGGQGEKGDRQREERGGGQGEKGDRQREERGGGQGEKGDRQREERICLTNLLRFLEEITKGVDDGSPVDVVYFDFQKAFVKVPHQRFLLKPKALSPLLSSHISPSLLALSISPQCDLLETELCIIKDASPIKFFACLFPS